MQSVEGDIVLRINLDDCYRFLVLVNKDTDIKQLKDEILKVARIALSVDIRELTSVQSATEFELPDIYPVGRLLKENDIVLAYSNRYENIIKNSSHPSKENLQSEATQNGLEKPTRKTKRIKYQNDSTSSENVSRNIQEEKEEENANNQQDEDDIEEDNAIDDNCSEKDIAAGNNQEASENVEKCNSIPAETNCFDTAMDNAELQETNVIDKENVDNQCKVQSLEKNEVFEEHQKSTKLPEKRRRRSHRHSRTQSLDESLAEESQRNRTSDSTSNASHQTSTISETIFNSPKFKSLLQTKEYRHPRRKEAIMRTVTKVAGWLVESKEKESIELQAIESNLENSQLTELDPTESFHTVIEVKDDEVIYFDSNASDASHSDGVLKKSELLTCNVVLPNCLISVEKSSDEPENQATATSGCQGTSDKEQDRNESQDKYQSPIKLPSVKKPTVMQSSLLKPCETGSNNDEDKSCISTEILECEDDVDRQEPLEKDKLPQESSSHLPVSSNCQPIDSQIQSTPKVLQLQNEDTKKVTLKKSRNKVNPNQTETKDKYFVNVTSLCGLITKKQSKCQNGVKEFPVKAVRETKKQDSIDNVDKALDRRFIDEEEEELSLISCSEEYEVENFQSKLNELDEAGGRPESQMSKHDERETLLTDKDNEIKNKFDSKSKSTKESPSKKEFEHHEKRDSSIKEKGELHNDDNLPVTFNKDLQNKKHEEKQLQKNNNNSKEHMTKTVIEQSSAVKHDQSPSHKQEKHKKKSKISRNIQETPSVSNEEGNKKTMEETDDTFAICQDESNQMKKLKNSSLEDCSTTEEHHDICELTKSVEDNVDHNKEISEKFCEGNDEVVSSVKRKKKVQSTSLEDGLSEHAKKHKKSKKTGGDNEKEFSPEKDSSMREKNVQSTSLEDGLSEHAKKHKKSKKTGGDNDKEFSPERDFLMREKKIQSTSLEDSFSEHAKKHKKSKKTGGDNEKEFSPEKDSSMTEKNVQSTSLENSFSEHAKKHKKSKKTGGDNDKEYSIEKDSVKRKKKTQNMSLEDSEILKKGRLENKVNYFEEEEEEEESQVLISTMDSSRQNELFNESTESKINSTKKKKKNKSDNLEYMNGRNVNHSVRTGKKKRDTCQETEILNNSSELKRKNKKKKKKQKLKDQEITIEMKVDDNVNRENMENNNNIPDSECETTSRNKRKRKHKLSDQMEVDGNGNVMLNIGCDTPRKIMKKKQEKESYKKVEITSQQVPPDDCGMKNEIPLQNNKKRTNENKKDKQHNKEGKQHTTRNSETYHEDTQVLSQVSQDSGMFTSDSESEPEKEPVKNLLSWIENRTDNETPRMKSSKTTGSRLLDLARDVENDQSTRKAVTPSKNNVLTGHLFNKAPKGFTNTVPRLKKKASSLSISSGKRTRRHSHCEDDISSTRVLTEEEQEMLSRGVSQLDSLLNNDAFWNVEK